MSKIDFKRTLRSFYAASRDKFVDVDVPVMSFVKVDGAGDPNTAPVYGAAVQSLYGVSYAMKFAARTTQSCAKDRGANAVSRLSGCHPVAVGQIPIVPKSV
tara:strand:+ start:295 stop:597 length:303 start_codon:yes stop_codon:yes gene_type:complete